MNFNLIEQNEWSYDKGFPAYGNPNAWRDMAFVDEAEWNAHSCFLHRGCWDLYENNLYNSLDDNAEFLAEDIYKLMTLERLISQLQAFSRKSLPSHLKNYHADDLGKTVKKLMLQQQKREHFQHEQEQSRFVSKYMNHWHDTQGSPCVSGQSSEKVLETEECSQMPSVEQVPEEVPSIKSLTLSSSSKTSEQKKSRQKSRYCRHFLKGHCQRGDSCSFWHDHSIFCSDMQKVFLRALPSHINSSLLTKEFEEQGYTVLNRPKILKRFSTHVCLGSVEEAKGILEKGTIIIDGAVVHACPFKARDRYNEEKQPDEVERSVFLGGLNSSTTEEMIKDVLGKMGLVVVNIPELKSGYAPRVVFETLQQAQTLLKKMRVQINGALVNVRPFANITRYKRKRKCTNSQL